jgi:His/Glu/Gln/Arg/opine family amino acid ABC transporter permease subunit
MKELLDTIVNSIYNNLIGDGAWLVVLKGLLVTIFISALGLLFGTIIGATLCAMRLSNSVFSKILSRLIIAVLRGSPVLLLLMVLYYVVFANNRIDAVYIAIIAFALNSGAHIAEIMRSALSGVDKKQLEAARMLGLSRFQGFMAITLPQAGRIAKPVYQNTIISLIQWTSVVGYVTITDLTRTVNNIGARTGDPFFALFVGILLYLCLSYLVYFLFSLNSKKILGL